jgi:hypothetical protein
MSWPNSSSGTAPGWVSSSIARPSRGAVMLVASRSTGIDGVIPSAFAFSLRISTTAALGLRGFTVRDPDGNLIGIAHEVHRPLGHSANHDLTAGGRPLAAHERAQTRSGRPHKQRVSVLQRGAEPHHLARVSGKTPHDHLPGLGRRPRTPPPSRRARPSRPRCEPWLWSVPPMRLWGRRAGVSCAATNVPHDRVGDRPASTSPAGRQPPYGLAADLLTGGPTRARVSARGRTPSSPARSTAG